MKKEDKPKNAILYLVQLFEDFKDDVPQTLISQVISRVDPDCWLSAAEQAQVEGKVRAIKSMKDRTAAENDIIEFINSCN